MSGQAGYSSTCVARPGQYVELVTSYAPKQLQRAIVAAWPTEGGAKRDWWGRYPPVLTNTPLGGGGCCWLAAGAVRARRAPLARSHRTARPHVATCIDRTTARTYSRTVGLYDRSRSSTSCIAYVPTAVLLQSTAGGCIVDIPVPYVYMYGCIAYRT